MKVIDINSKQVFHGAAIDNYGDNYISIYNIERRLIAQVPSRFAKLVFNENEIPYMEEMK